MQGGKTLYSDRLSSVSAAVLSLWTDGYPVNRYPSCQSYSAR